MMLPVIGCLIISVANAQSKPTALVGGMLIDGTGGPVIMNSVVLIRDELIEDVGDLTSLSVPEGYEEISTEGMTVLPGLWDPHAHLIYNGHPSLGYWTSTYKDQFASVTIPAAAKQVLMAGVTSVRDLAVPTEDILTIKKQIENDELPGPTIYTSGYVIQPAGYSTMPHFKSISGTSEARNLVNQLADSGVDVIKVVGADSMTREDLQAIVQEAHSRELKVTAHGRTDEEILAGLSAGVDEFQHIGTVTSQFPPEIITGIQKRIESGADLHWTPTIGIQMNSDRFSKEREFLDDPKNFVGVPETIAQDIKTSIATASPEMPSPDIQQSVRNKITQLKQLGVILISGSDMGVFGAPTTQATWRDIEVWVRDFGLNPMDAIIWATADSAKALGAGEHTGTITPNKFADVIAVNGNPLENIGVLGNVSIVLKHGRRYK